MTRLPSPEHVGELLDELAVLIPALLPALPRDAGTSSGEKVATSANVHTIPINPDVASALIRLSGLDVEGLRLRYGQAYEAAINRTHPDAEAHCHQAAAAIRDHLNTARHALGLNRPDLPLPGPRHCPNHDDPLQPLTTPGARGTLIYDRLHQGRPVNPWIRWTRAEVIMCRHCGLTWTPSQYMRLGRWIEYADQRRAAARTVEA